MDNADPINEAAPIVESQETLEKTNVQKRIDELTALRYAAEKRAEDQAAQVAQLTALVAKQMEAQHQAVQRPVVQEEQLPEGIDPAMAKFFKGQIEQVRKQSEQQAQQMFWQMQNQMDSQNVTSKYGQLPPEVLKEAANILTGIKQRNGGVGNMDDAVAVAHFQWYQKQGRQNQAAQYNAIGQPLQMHGTPPNVQQQQSSNLVPPTSRADWDNLDNATQTKLVDAYVKAGGRLMG